MIVRLAAWNVQNGGSTRRPGIVAELAAHEPDIIVLGEWRPETGARASFEELLADAGLVHQSAPSRPEVAGVLVASRWPLELVGEGPEGLSERFQHVRVRAGGRSLDVIGVYVPSGGGGNITPKRAYLDWLLGCTPQLLRAEAIVMLGDFNCDHRDDTGARERLVGEPRFQQLFPAGWRDLYRELHRPGTAASYWSSHGNGYRLDHALAGPGVQAVDVRYAVGRHGHRYVRTAGAPADRRLSDHALLLADVKLPQSIISPPPP